MSTMHPLLRPYKPTSDDPFDAVKAAHLLNRAGFGGTGDEIDYILSLGPVKAVNWLFDFPEAGVEEQTQTDVPDLSNIQGYPRTFREMQQRMREMTPEERMAYRQRLGQDNRQAVIETGRWWLNRMAYGPHPLQEKLTLLWHGHFTTSAREERSAFLMWQQNELLRRQAAGNFREFVREISRDPAMLDYLNNQQNRKRSPNENYARELMELFTLGIGNYTEHDIKEAARAFTGWAHDGEGFIFRRYDHDDGEKVFFGFRGNFTGDDVIEIILQHPVCARYIAGKIFGWFGYENIEPPLLEVMANQLRAAKWEMRPLLRNILLSQAFYSPKAIGTQIKSPVQLVVGTVRILDVQFPQQRQLIGALNQMGQVPLEPPNVKGWPGGRTWVNTSTLFARYNTAVTLAGGTGNPRNSSFRPDFVEGSPQEVVDHWINRLIQRPIDHDKKQVLVATVGDRPTEASVRKLVQLIVSMPEYQLC